MPQVINDPYRNESQRNAVTNQPWVSGVSNLISGLIQGQTQRLAERRQREQTATGLQHLLNIPAREAHSLASLDPNLLEHVVKSKLGEPSRQAYAQGLSQIFAPENNISAGNQPSESNPQMANQIAETQSAGQPFPDADPQMIREAQALNLGQLNEKQASDLANLALKKQKMTLEEKRELRKAEHEEKVFQHQLKKDALSETKEIRKDLFSKKKAAHEALESIDRLEELEKEGLPTAGWNEFVKNAGLDIPALSGAPAEEYNKIAANFIRNAKSIFGSRITDNDIAYFLKTVPSLANSPEGRKRINANLKRMARLDLAAVDSYNDIVKENGGLPPLDLDIKLDEALDKKREAVYNQFKKDLTKEVPAAQNKLLTAAGSAAGSAVNVLGNTLASTVNKAGPLLTGAYIGSRFGPYGAVAGGTIGVLGSSIWDFLKK